MKKNEYKNDKKEYKNFKELQADKTENVDYKIEVIKRGSGTAIIAPHGGGIEPGTTDLTEAIAGNNHSYYIFSGIMKDGNKVLHITSTNFDEPKCEKLVKNTKLVISIHGSDVSDKETKLKYEKEKSIENCIFLGGKNSAYIEKIEKTLVKKRFDIGVTPQRLGAKSEENITNKGKSEDGGVQIEIQKGLREQMFKGSLHKRVDRKKKTKLFYDFVDAIREAIE